MKITIKILGIIAIAAIIACTMVACGGDDDESSNTGNENGSNTNPFKGTWTAQWGDKDNYTYVFGDTTFEGTTITTMPAPDNRINTLEIKGSYTFTGNAVTVIFTEAKHKVNDGEWEYDEEYIGESLTLTLSGGKLLLSDLGLEFTKQTGNGNTNVTNPFKGTWTGTVMIQGDPNFPPFPGELTFIFTDTTFEFSNLIVNENGSISIKQKGNYSYTAATATTNVTAVDYIRNDVSETNGWASDGDYFNTHGVSTTLTLSNGKLIMNGVTGDITKMN